MFTHVSSRFKMYQSNIITLALGMSDAFYTVDIRSLKTRTHKHT